MKRALIFTTTAVLVTLVVSVSGLAQAPASNSGKTHQFQPKTYYTTFSGAHPPALHIAPGDKVVTKTVDARGYDENEKKVAGIFNPETGPFYIDGAQPGDMLVVRIDKIQPNRKTAWSAQVLAPYAVDPFYLRSVASRVKEPQPCVDLKDPACEKWALDLDKKVARTTTANLKPPLEVPFHNMLGCLGVAPPNKEAINTGVPGVFGGNMDYFNLNEGVTVMLPVFEPGALLFVGDGHARQGHGEVSGNAIEVSMDVEFTVNLVKRKTIEWPRLENNQYIMVAGSSRDFLGSLQAANTELQKWLMTDYGFDERAAGLLMTAVLEYDIANVVDPAFTIVAKLDKRYLPKRN